MGCDMTVRRETRTRTRSEATASPPENVQPQARVRERSREVVRTEVPATVSTGVTHKQNGHEVHRETNISRFPVEVPAAHATVHVGGKVTWQPKAYESITVEVGMWFPCAPTEEAADATYRASSEWVERKINREIALARGELPEEPHAINPK